MKLSKKNFVWARNTTLDLGAYYIILIFKSLVLFKNIKMRLVILSFFVLNILTQALCQEQEPVILQGQFLNCPKRELTVSIQNVPGLYTHEEIKLNEDGTFYLKTNKITVPQDVAIRSLGFSINPLFVAPGYNLTLKCDGRNLKTIKKTLEISGIGKESNYAITGDSYHDYSINFEEPSKKKFLQDINKVTEIEDSIYKIQYVEKITKEPYFNYFSEVIKLNLHFDKLYKLITYSLLQPYSAKEIERFVQDNYDNQTLDNFSNDNWLISSSYRKLVSDRFLRYQMIIDTDGDKILIHDEDYILNKITELYDSQTREYVYVRFMRGSFSRSKDLSELRSTAERFEPFIEDFRNESYKEYLDQIFQDKVKQLYESQVGKKAPMFNLPDTTGKYHSLQDYIGKVVYLDFWGSWCKPCREETPFLKEIYNEFHDSKDMVFIGIAIKDLEENWIKAVNKDKPKWLQLIDVDQKVSKQYHVNILPRYIIIDKEGNLADPDAPRPREKEKLINILNTEIIKN